MIEEIWKDIFGYEGLYQVSNLGRIKSYDKYKWNRFKYIKLKGKQLKLSNDKNGYKIICLTKNKKEIMHKVHRLVAKAFIPNPNNYSCINHKNEIKDDNRVENLEWCDVKYNNIYGSRINKVKTKLNKKVNQYDLQGNFIKTYNSMQSIKEHLKINNISSISVCCNHKKGHKSAFGYKWEFCNIPKED